MGKLALLVFVGGVGYAAAHAHCISKAVDLDQTLSFCPTADEGVCCTEAEEGVVEERFNLAGTLTAECGDYYKEVLCAICGPFSGHLFERLLSDLGTLDGLTMTNSFCLEFVDACADQIDFPTYEDGQDYCTKHTGGGDDLYWSYPYMLLDHGRWAYW